MKRETDGAQRRPDQTIDQPVFWEPSLAFLKYAIALVLAGSAAYLIAIFLFIPDQAWRAASPVSTALVAAAAWFLLAHGRHEATVRVLAFGTWAAVTGIAYFNGGIGASVIVVYPLTILMAGWLVSTRAAVVVAVLTVAVTLGFAVAESLGSLPSSDATPPAMRWLVLGIVAALSVVLIVFVVRSYRDRLLEVRALGGNLAQSSADFQSSAADLNRAQAVAHVGSWVYELATDTLRLSAEASRIFGLPEGAVSSWNACLAQAHPEDRGAAERAWNTALRLGANYESEHRIVVGDSIRWISHKAEPEFGANGMPLRCHGTTQDISERKRLEEALREQTERLLIGQRAARMVIIDWDIVKDELVWSDSPEWMRGPLPATGKYPLFVDQVHPEDRNRFLATRAEAIDTLLPGSVEYRLVRTDGQVVWIRSQRTVLAGPNGKAARMILAEQDVTERKRAEAERTQLEAQLREAQKMEALGALAGGVAHNFNNIVAGIMLNAELASQDVGPGHAALESLEEIREASRRAKEVVQQILTFSRRHALGRQAISLAPVITESEQLLRATMPSALVLNVVCAADAPTVMADATQIQQVLVNLCTNAVQAMKGRKQPPNIEIRLEAFVHTLDTTRSDLPAETLRTLRTGRYACLTVRDDGPGMDEATRARIFEPFFTTKPAGEGTGLGLAVVHGIVQAHGGTISVHSTPGKGAVFRIYFPAIEVPAAAAQERAQQPEPSAQAQRGDTRLAAEQSGKRIIYVDDDEAIVLLMTRLLGRLGYQVSGYPDGPSALAAVRAAPGRFDLAVTDYSMPGMSGLELARLLRGIRADLPVAIATGYITEELRIMARAAGVRELIYKPNSVHDLCAAVARLAARPPA